MWIVAPTLFLCAFLIASEMHFAGYPAADVTKTSRGLYGGAMIVLPAWWHGEELQRLLRWLGGPDSAAAVAPVLGKLAVPWLVATMLACAFQFRTSLLAACESAGLAALSVAAPPLVAFCAYFSPCTVRDISSHAGGRYSLECESTNERRGHERHDV